MKRKDRSARFITWTGDTVIFLLALLPVAIYFLMGINQVVGDLESRADLGAVQLSRMINLNPDHWMNDEYRIEELLTQHTPDDSRDAWKVTDVERHVVFESSPALKGPLLSRSRVLRDFGGIAGRVEITRSIFGLIRNSAILGLSTLSAGFLVFTIFRRRALFILVKTERQLRESERKYRQLFNAETDAILLLDGQTRNIIDINHAAGRLYGYPRDEFLQLNLSDISAEPELSASSVSETMERGRLSIPLRRHIRKDGTTFPAEISAGTFTLKGRKVICGIIRDITRRKEDEEKLLSYQSQLRALSSKLSSVEESERRDLAAALHDEVGQLLAMCRLYLEEEGGTEGESGGTRDIGKGRELLEEAITRVRSLTWEISPPSLYDLGLETAVEELCEEFEKHHSLHCVISRKEEKADIPHALRGTLYRSIREILSNVLRHADATETTIEFFSENGWFRAVVSDNGRGFEVGEVEAPPTFEGRFGLFNIRERVNLLGGDLRISSAPGEGTQVTVLVPLEDKGDAGRA